MYIPKRYGQSKINKCPFCGKDAFSQNKQKIPTCREHKEQELGEMKCVCGSWLEMREGKFGVFFTCLHCGALNLRKVLEMNNVQTNSLCKTKCNEAKSVASKASKTDFMKEEKKEITISSDELDFI